MQSAVFSPRTLEAVYRFALLLTGEAGSAAAVVLEALRDGSNAAQLRNDKHRNACLAMKVREIWLKKERAGSAEPASPLAASSGAIPPVPAENQAPPGLPASFHGMPEPQRSVLALFYVDLFPASDLLQLFRLKPNGLAETLAAGRVFLREHLERTLPA